MKVAVAVAAVLLIASVVAGRDTVRDGYPGRWRVPTGAGAAGSPPVVHDGAPPWAGGANCSGGFTPGAEELGPRLQASFAQITRVFGYECRPNTALPNETSQHGTGRALDLAIPRRDGDANNDLGDPVANWLVTHSSRIGVQLIIWGPLHLDRSALRRKRPAVHRAGSAHRSHPRRAQPSGGGTGDRLLSQAMTQLRRLSPF
jgi:hypothetical protein